MVVVCVGVVVEVMVVVVVVVWWWSCGLGWSVRQIAEPIVHAAPPRGLTCAIGSLI